MNKIYSLKEEFSKLGDYNTFENINKGYERYMMLIHYYQNYKDFTNNILIEYNLVNI